MNTTKPVLYSFRRCPYAIRARIALIYKGIDFDLREVDLKNKPADMLAFSPKGTVPVLVLPSGRVIDESLQILDLVLDYEYDQATELLIAAMANDYFPSVMRLKYPERYTDLNLDKEYGLIKAYIRRLDDLLGSKLYLFGDDMQKADMAILPFIRYLHRANEAWFSALPDSNTLRWFYRFYESELHAKVMAKF